MADIRIPTRCFPAGFIRGTGGAVGAATCARHGLPRPPDRFRRPAGPSTSIVVRGRHAAATIACLGAYRESLVILLKQDGVGLVPATTNPADFMSARSSASSRQLKPVLDLCILHHHGSHQGRRHHSHKYQYSCSGPQATLLGGWDVVAAEEGGLTDAAWRDALGGDGYETLTLNLTRNLTPV